MHQSVDRKLREEALPFYESHGRSGTFAGVGGLVIHYRAFELPDSRGDVVISPGRAEPAYKYAETAYDLSRQGYSVYVIDHRGQGESGRMIDLPASYVERFSDYVDDFAKFVADVLPARRSDRPRHLLAHSMGGAIATFYLTRADARGAFDSAAFSAPMFEIDTGRIFFFAALAIVSAEAWRGRAQRFALFQGPPDPDRAFIGNPFTSNPERFQLMREWERSHPERALGGASNHWIRESLGATRRIQELAPRLTLPLLILEAGKDRIVRGGALHRFAREAPRSQVITLENSRHEILQEADAIRDRAIDAIVDFFAKHASA